jgi:hypothetical protein
MSATVMRQPWDLLRVMLVAAVLTMVWRLQDLVPVLAPLRLPTLVLLALAHSSRVSDRTEVGVVPTTAST